SALAFSTYLGGSADEFANAIALDNFGSVYVTGVTDSTNFPIVNPLQPAFAGGSVGFVTKLTEAPAPIIYNVPFTGGRPNLVLRRNTTLVELPDTGVLARSRPLAVTTGISVFGAANQAATLTVDNTSGGLVALPGNPTPAINFTGGTGGGT